MRISKNKKEKGVIFICEICQKMNCLPQCPNYIEKKPRIHCVSCGERLDLGEGFYTIHGFPYCESCLDFADAETLIRICEIPKRKWLEQMGFEYQELKNEN